MRSSCLRAYGFESWPKLKAFVDGASLRRLRDAIVANDLVQVREILKVLPELARGSIELQMLHSAVFNRSSEMVRLLMRHGAPARHGAHRDATTLDFTAAGSAETFRGQC